MEFMKNKFIALCTLTILMGLTACANFDNSEFTQTQTHGITNLMLHEPFYLYEIDLSLDKHRQADAIFLLDDGSMIFIRTGSNHEVGSYRHIYRYFLESGTYIDIGRFYRFAVSTGRYALLDNIIYFYATVGDANNHMLINVLFGIDLENNKLIHVAEDTISDPIVNTFSIGDRLISLKIRAEGEVGISYLEIFDPKTNLTEIVSKACFDATTREGIIYLLHTIDDNNWTYVLYQIALSGSDAWRSLIRVYDENFDFKKYINMSEVEQNITGYFSNNFRVFGDFVYIYTFTSFPMNSLIGRIDENGSLYAIHEGHLSLVDNFSADNIQLFFWRLSNILVLLDTDTGILHQTTIPLDNGYRIMNIIANGDIAFVTAVSADFNSNRYFFTRFR